MVEMKNEKCFAENKNMLSTHRNIYAREQLADELLFELTESEYYRAFNQLFPTRDRRGSSMVPPEDLPRKIRIFFNMDDPELETLIDEFLDDYDINKFVGTYKEYCIIRAEEEARIADEIIDELDNRESETDWSDWGDFTLTSDDVDDVDEDEEEE